MGLFVGGLVGFGKLLRRLAKVLVSLGGDILGIWRWLGCARKGTESDRLADVLAGR